MTDLDTPGPEGRAARLYPHQRVGVDWLASRSAGLLADEQGLGKTATALQAADRLRARRVLVLAPAVVTFNWAVEAAEWFTGPEDTVQVVRTGRCAVDPNARLVIVSHGLLTRRAVVERLWSIRWDVLVVDEAHNFRTPDAKRTRALFGAWDWPHGPSLVDAADVVWLLSGTPMPNHAAELWTMLWGLDPGRVADASGATMSYRAFQAHHCHLRQTRYGVKVTGNRNLPELRGRLQGFSLRRTKAQHLDLPPVRWDLVTLAPDRLDAELRAMDAALGEDMAEALQTHAEDPEAAFELLRDSHELTTFRRLCGLAKAPAVAELLISELEVGALDKVVVFGVHRGVLDHLQQCLDLAGIGTVRIDGSTSQPDRQTAVTRFQSEPGVRVLLGNIQAAGVGITLTAAADVVFAELSWTPGDNAQAADRIHRIGQTAESVRVRFVALANTADEMVTATLRNKVRMIREVLK